MLETEMTFKSYLLNILVTVQYQHVSGMGHQRTFWLVLINAWTNLKIMINKKSERESFNFSWWKDRDR